MSRKSSNRLGKLLLALTTVLLVLILLGGLVGFGLYQSLSAPVSPGSQEQASFIIERGAGVNRIAADLQKEGLIRNALVFKIITRQLNLSTRLQAGVYQLSPAMDAREIAQALTVGRDDTTVTIREGLRREEIAAEFEKVLGTEQFDTQEFLRLTQGKEGYLYPSTYSIAKTTTTAEVVELLEQTFNQQIETIAADIERSPYSLNQIITMASIVEREAREDRAIVAGILWKRLEAGMPLQVDATLQYAKGYDQTRKTWWPTPLSVDKEINSPYNTYQNTGLPPAPIASPSLDAIEATVNYQESDYWFYLTDNQGHMRYGEDYDQHLQNINRYLR